MHRASREWILQTKAKAEAGDSEAQYYLGRCCLEGNGVEQDEEAGFAWLEESAIQDYAEAQYALGLLYQESRNPDNYRKAVLWFEKAARQGVADAQRSLSVIYAMGLPGGVSIDSEKAAFWREQAMESSAKLVAANSTSIHAGDGSTLRNQYVTAAIKGGVIGFLWATVFSTSMTFGIIFGVIGIMVWHLAHGAMAMQTCKRLKGGELFKTLHGATIIAQIIPLGIILLLGVIVILKFFHSFL